MHINENPAVSPAFSKLQSIKANLAAADRERDAAISGSNNTTVSNRDRAAQALLDGQPADVATASNLAELTERVQTLRRAVEIQQSVYDKATYEASNRIATDRRPDYAAIVKRGAKAVKALRDFIADERAFRENLAEAGVTFGNVIHTLPIPRLDELCCDAWLSSAREHYSAL